MGLSRRKQAPLISGRSQSGTQRRHASTTRKSKLPDTPARTRFAPSPTGNLHLGSIRTALFNYLLARRTNGQFLLRIEDTDQKRTVPGAEEQLYEDLRWAGLQWDEGPTVGGQFGPYRQSERTATYHKHVQTLLESNKAYRCFCSAERIDNLNRLRHDRGLPLGYDRACAGLAPYVAEEKAHNGEAHVIRFRVPKEYPKFNDFVYGKTGHGMERSKKLLVDEPVYDDPILIKSDGFPTYHFANVVDDKLMEITHVIRGSEWMSSTPLHVALYEAFGWTPPAFGHVPLLVDQNKQKLSKRNFDSDIASFRRSGIFPESLINFAALLGWSHQRKNDIMNLQELQEIFDLKFTKGNTIVSFDKLRYLQEQHARRRVVASGEELEQMIRDVAIVLLEKHGAGTMTTFVGKRQLRDVVASMLQVTSLPYRSATDFAEQCALFLDDLKRPSLAVNDVYMLRRLRVAGATLCLVPNGNWTKDVHRANLMNLQMEEHAENDSAIGKKWKHELYHYLRWALLGGTAGPGIPETMEILGRSVCVERLQSAALATKDLETMATKPDLGMIPRGREWQQHTLASTAVV